MLTNTFTHQIRFPPLTDLVRFLGAYKQLFESMGIGSNLNVEYCDDLSHPIPEEHQILTDDYMMTFVNLRDLHAELGNSLTNTGVNINQHSAIFIFSYET